MMEGDNCHEEIEVHGVADRVRAEAGGERIAVAEVCRKMGISEATFYNWKKKFSGLGPDELTATAVGRRERAAEADRGGPNAGQTDAPGRVKKKL